MGLDKQRRKTSITAPVLKKDRDKKVSEMWRERFLVGKQGPPLGTPVGRFMGGEGPAKDEIFGGEDGMAFPERYWNKKHEGMYQKGLIDGDNNPLPENLRRKFLMEKAKKKALDAQKKKFVDEENANQEEQDFFRRQRELREKEVRSRTTS